MCEIINLKSFPFSTLKKLMQCLLASSTRDEKSGVFVILVPVLSKMSFFILLITPSVQLNMNNYALKMVCLYVPSDRCFFLFLRTQVPCERGL